MNMFKLLEKLSKTHLCRCKFWVVCDRKSCYHFEPHSPSRDHCLMFSPVKYCEAVRGFVYDIPMADIDSNYECDPNLAFKAKRDAERRESSFTNSYNRSNDSNYDSYIRWKEEQTRRDRGLHDEEI